MWDEREFTKLSVSRGEEKGAMWLFVISPIAVSHTYTRIGIH